MAEQILVLFDNTVPRCKYVVSTARNGLGELTGSECTPRGQHLIAEKIGAGCATNTVFVGRVASGKVYEPHSRKRFPGCDWIVTRILRLQGCEENRNKGGNVDSYERYIYIHGSPDDITMGVPGSRGCIRMSNQDIIELFDLIDVGTTVNIY